MTLAALSETVTPLVSFAMRDDGTATAAAALMTPDPEIEYADTIRPRAPASAANCAAVIVNVGAAGSVRVIDPNEPTTKPFCRVSRLADTQAALLATFAGARVVTVAVLTGDHVAVVAS